MSNEVKKAKYVRQVVTSGNDPQEVYQEYVKVSEKYPMNEYAFADVRQMTDPPKTIDRYVVIRIVERVKP